MKTNNKDGCGLCNATWGEYYREIDKDNMFFCCNICADIFENMVKEVKKRTGWEIIDEVKLEGNYSKGRECTAYNNGKEYHYYFRTYGDGKMMEFREL